MRPSGVAPRRRLRCRPRGPRSLPRTARCLSVDALLEPRLLQDWSGWIRGVGGLNARLAQLAESGTLDLVLTGGRTLRRLRTRPSDRLKFWRNRNLEELLSE